MKKLFSKFVWFLAKKFCDNNINQLININKSNASVPKVSELECYIGKPVICISNEIDNPVVGFAIDIVKFNDDDLEKLQVCNFVNMQVVTVFGKIYHYDFELLQGLYDNDLEYTIKLLYKTSFTDKNKVNERYKSLLSFHEIIEKLKYNNFYSRLKDYIDETKN